MFGCAFTYAQINIVNEEEDLYIKGNYEHRISENPKIGKHAEIHKEAGEQYITRIGTKVQATNLLVDGKKEIAKDVEVNPRIKLQ